MIFVRREKYRQVLSRRHFTVQFWRNRYFSSSAEKKLPRERCKVNLLEISRTRRICRNYRLLGKHADKVRAVQRWSTGGKSSAIVLHPFLETRVVTSPCPRLFPSPSSVPFFRSLSRSCHGGESHFRATEFLRDDRGEPGIACIQIRGT